VWSLLVDGQPARPKRSRAQVLVPLPTGTAERSSQLSLVLLRRGEGIPSFGTIRPMLPDLDVPVPEAMWTLYLPDGRRYRPIGDGFRVLGVTAPLVGDGFRGGLSGIGRMTAQSVLDEAADYVSEGLAEKQKAQQDQIVKQMAVRQGASRRGSLPVRINLPGGVSNLPNLTVARILIVDEGETLLPIRVYPGWSRSALRSLQGLLILAAGVLVALLATGRLAPGRGRWVALVSIAAILPVGGISVVPAVIMILTVAAVAALVGAIHRRHQTRARLATEESQPIDREEWEMEDDA
jgi:hypothetical protein